MRYCVKLSEQTKQYGFEIKYLETSAKTGLNVKEAFESLARVYLNYVEHEKKVPLVYNY